MNKNMNKNEYQIRSPWHLWLIGLIFTFLYSYAIYDIFMMLGHNEAYYSSKHLGKAAYTYFTNYPVFPLIFWVLNIVSGAIAPILLLLRSRLAVPTSLISAISIIILEFITFTFRNRWNALGSSIGIFDIIMLLITVGLYFYCKAMGKLGVLK
ncbi:MAG TPA: hypothetical protein VHQ24_04020 [Lachnospiraceae bacterium]|nr:hypothetical protein [Lachnospiraceae bacterium]